MSSRVFKYSALFLVFALLGYPLLYYAYKFGTPEFGGLDVYSYLKLYTNWDFAAVDAPFNQRLVSTYLTYLLHSTGLHYSTETAIAGLGLDPSVYFAALLVNFAAVVATCIVIFRIVERFVNATPLFAFTAGLIYLLGFGTIFFQVSALTDALSVLLLAGAFYFYLARSLWLLPVFLLAIFQREYIFIVFGGMAAFHWLFVKSERRYFLQVLLASMFCFAVYLVLRKTLFHTPRYDHQLSIGDFLGNLSIAVKYMKGYFSQTFLIQNLLLIYVILCLYKYFSKMPCNRQNLLLSLFLLGEIVVISFLSRLGNNTGRYFYMTAPIIIYFIAVEAWPLLQKKSNTN
ncbi:MAG: hypothetical protein FD123_4083 [Bacteroidetes bacterium]|nr:MAG: hypothetical protein FD123_4083 [Bacteroidota bacterium]